MHLIMTKKMREIVLLLLFFLPRGKKITVERWLRGQKEFRKLTAADCVVVSFGKSGRTWLRVMLSRFYQRKHGLPPHHLLEFDNFYRQDQNIPKIFFTHDSYIKDYTNNRDSKVDFYDKRVVLLVRDPRDVAVSQFFQWKYRMKPAKKQLNNFPAHGADITVDEFIINYIPQVLAFMNNWAKEIPQLKNILVVRYEDMQQRPEAELKRLLAFLGTPGSDEQTREAVAFASYDNMRQLEDDKVFQASGSRLVSADQKNPDSHKVRRAKVGGYRDYLDERGMVAIDELVHSRLSPLYGYGQVGDLSGA